MSKYFIFANLAKTSLGADLASGATSCTFTDGSQLSSPVGEQRQQLILLDNETNPTQYEVVTLMTRSGNAGTIVRAQEGTTQPVSWPAVSTIVAVRLTAGILNTFVQVEGTQLRLDNAGNSKGLEAINIQTGRHSDTKIASGQRAVAIGYDAMANGQYSIAIGYSADAAEAATQNDIAIGYNTRAAGPNAICIGSSSSSIDSSCIAIGFSTWCEYNGGVAIGYSSFVNSDKGVAIGYAATSGSVGGELHGIAIGRSSRASKNDCIGIGYTAEANADFTIAIGRNSVLTVEGGIGIGLGARVDSAWTTHLVSPIINVNTNSTHIASAGYTGAKLQAQMCGARITLGCKIFNLKTVADGVQTITIPTGCHLIPQNIIVYITATSTVTVDPDVALGTTSGGTELLAATTQTETGQWQVNENAPVSKNGIAGTIYISVKAAASASGSLTARVFIEGILIED